MVQGTAIDVLVTAPQMLVTLFLIKKCARMRRMALFGALYVGYSCAVYILAARLGVSVSFKSLLVIVVPVGFGAFFCEDPICRLAILHCLSCTFQVIIDIIMAVVIFLIYGEGTYIVFETLGLTVAVKLMCFVLYASMCLGFYRLWPRLRFLHGTVPNSFVVLAGAQSLMCVVILEQGLVQHFDAAFVITAVICVAACCLGDVLILKYIRQLQGQRLLAEENRVMHVQLQAQLAHYNALIGGIEQTSRLRHDMNNQLQTVYALLESGELGPARSMTAELRRRWDHTPHRYCENLVADAILAEKARRCAEDGVALELRAELPGDLPVEGVDLCSLFGNVLDNAISACLRLPPERREIRLRAGLYGEWLTVEAENPRPPAAEAPAEPEAAPFRAHGLGLEIVKALAEKYDGRVTLGGGPERFSITVQLRLGDGAEASA